ncbi:hypothetical protein [Nocardia asteroides]|uniref:hypothetical protein n=1 Tax=Nocardia asteroides TaxID=1824 RepID=UPI001E556800|nr:hypothetical protein [Nocardia asteroides]UGT58964.1 hypothetical protein LTT61_16810 [Nocardia asteroides]
MKARSRMAAAAAVAMAFGIFGGAVAHAEKPVGRVETENYSNKSQCDRRAAELNKQGISARVTATGNGCQVIWASR